ncbi:MAG: hypothetical protein JNM72_09300, partial [Deltaproteobacteria bacterium]|nr:hypothetical protein [Deltaproteobacteria bacterium]
TWSRATLTAAAAESPALEYAMQVLHRFTEDEILRRQLEREEDRARILAGRARHAEREAAEKAAALARLAELEREAAENAAARQQERAQAERALQQVEQERAQAEQRAAIVEREKAEAEQRAEALAARLRALGIDPSTV